MANGGTDVQIINFTSDETYQLVIDIIGVSQPFGESLDESRNGRAIGIVVVPEFNGILGHNSSTISSIGFASIITLGVGILLTVGFAAVTKLMCFAKK